MPSPTKNDRDCNSDGAHLDCVNLVSSGRRNQISTRDNIPVTRKQRRRSKDGLSPGTPGATLPVVCFCRHELLGTCCHWAAAVVLYWFVRLDGCHFFSKMWMKFKDGRGESWEKAASSQKGVWRKSIGVCLVTKNVFPSSHYNWEVKTLQLDSLVLCFCCFVCCNICIMRFLIIIIIIITTTIFIVLSSTAPAICMCYMFVFLCFCLSVHCIAAKTLIDSATANQ